MSELKAYNVVATADVNPDVVDNLGCTEWLGYDKDEADKVIAEKDAEIAQLQATLEERNKQVGKLKEERDWLAKDRAQAYDDLEKRAQLNIKQEESIRRHKYKRCLAMAWWCSAELGMFVSTLEFKIKHYKKWQKRWLEYAKKFKEAK